MEYDYETLVAIERELIGLLNEFSHPLSLNENACVRVRHHLEAVRWQMQEEDRKRNEWVTRRMAQFDSVIQEIRRK